MLLHALLILFKIQIIINYKLIFKTSDNFKILKLLMNTLKLH